MGLYSDLADDALANKIVELRTGLETAMQGGVAVIAGEGRRMEYTKANADGLKYLLREAMNERDERAGDCVGNAIGVIWP